MREVVDAEVHLVSLRGAVEGHGHDPGVEDECVQRDPGIEEGLAVVGDLAQVGHLQPRALQDDEIGGRDLVQDGAARVLALGFGAAREDDAFAFRGELLRRG